MLEQRQNLSAGRKSNVTAWAIPLIPIAAVAGFLTVFARWGLIAAVSFWIVMMTALVAWSVGQRRRARQEIREEIETFGGRVMEMDYRHLRLGPFSLMDSSRSQIVYRVVVQEATGRERIVWARWGRKWFWNADQLELRWQDDEQRG